jgi:ATP-dependent 26S proteasome regulatory subunit
VDELDCFGSRQQHAEVADGTSLVAHRALATLLNELDGVSDGRSSVTDALSILACTSRPELVEEALIRPGRLQELILVPPPSHRERMRVMRSCLARLPLSPQVS